MAVQLFRLRNVSEEEARAICDLLEQNAIDFYVTPAGNWGISMPAIWLHDNSRLDEARRLIDEFQQQYTLKARQEYEQRRLEGRHTRLRDVIRENPFLFLIYFVAILVILLLATLPFVFMGK